MPRDLTDTVPADLVIKSEGGAQIAASDTDAVAKAIGGLTAQVSDAMKANAEAVAALKADFEGFKIDIEKKAKDAAEKSPEKKPEGQGDTQKTATDDAVTKAIAALKDELANVKTALNRPGLNTGKGDAADMSTEEKALGFARIARALACTKGNTALAAEVLEKNFGSPMLAKALATTPISLGGALVPEAFSTALIEMLRPSVVVRRLAGGPLPMPMPNGNMTLPNQLAGSQATWIGQNQVITASQPAFGQKKLQARKLAGLVPASNELIAYSGVAADQVILNDIRLQLGIAEDETLLRGAPDPDAPTGLRFLALPAHIIAATAGMTLDSVTSDLLRLMLLLKSANVRMERPGWIISPRTEIALMGIRDGNGNYAFRMEMMAGKILNIPYASTTAIPDNLGAGSDSEIILVDMAQVYLGEGRPLRIDTSVEAAWFNGAAVQSAFSQDQTVFRTIEEIDMILRQDAAVAVLTGVTWVP